MHAIEIDWSEEVTEKDFVDFLNEAYSPVDICGLEMQQGNILFECDPIGFQEAYNNHLDYESKEQGNFECGECGERYQYREEAEECCQEEIEEVDEEIQDIITRG